MKKDIVILNIERLIGASRTHSSLAEETQTLESVFRGWAELRRSDLGRGRSYTESREGMVFSQCAPGGFDSRSPKPSRQVRRVLNEA